MKLRLLLIILLVFNFFDAISQVYVEGYYRQDGTYVQSHYRSSPDGNPYNNYSFPGNYNPYTGKIATGREETYLANYYRVYAGQNSSESMNNYNHNLLNVNYWGAIGRERSTIDNNGVVTGYISKKPYTSGTYIITDLSDKFIGQVTFGNNKYSIHDSFGMKLYSVNKNGQIKLPDGGATTFAWAMLGVLAAVIVVTLSLQ